MSEDRETAWTGGNRQRMRRRCGRPHYEPNRFAVAEQQHVVIRPTHYQALVETEAFEQRGQCPGRSVGGLRVVHWVAGAVVRKTNRTEVMLPLLGVRAIVVPVVPDGERNAVGQIVQPLAWQ